MSGGYDDGIENLRRYLAIAANALERIQATTPEIESQGNSLDDLAGEVDSKMSAFDSETDGFLTDLQSAETDALEEVSKVTSLAQDAADDRLPDAEHDAEEAGGRIEGSMDAGGQELTSDHQALNGEGFDALASALEAAQQAFDATRTQNEAAFQALKQAMEGFEQDAESAYTDSGHELEGASGECATEASNLGTETTGLVDAMGTAGSEFGGKVAEVETEAEGAYDGINQQVESEARELTEGVHQALEAEAQHLATELTDSVEQASTLVTNSSAGPHLEELGTLREAVWRAESAGADLEPLVGDLQRCQQVMDLIDQLLNALQ
jgi:hypothetical protein